MGLPNITITFAKTAETVSRRAGQGTVALILSDTATAAQGLKLIGAESDIPATMGADNKAYINRAMIGYVNRPSKIIAYVMTAEESISDALAALAAYEFDWLAGPPDLDAAGAGTIKTWIESQRSDYDKIYKAVLPSTAADSAAIVNFTGSGIAVSGDILTTAEYCSRIAGLIAGTPLTQSITFAPLSDASDVERLTRAELDAAVEAGKLVLLHDGVKVKVGRGVTSLTTTTNTSALLKKIKLAETLDLIKHDLRILTQDTYIGRLVNSYDNKIVLLGAYLTYLKELEAEGVLQRGTSKIEIDVDAQRDYLRNRGDNVTGMTDAQIKTANTDSHVFVKGSIRMLDAIEDVDLDINF